MNQILDSIREKHGPDALIVSTKELPNRSFVVEVALEAEVKPIVSTEDAAYAPRGHFEIQDDSLLKRILFAHQLSPMLVQDIMRADEEGTIERIAVGLSRSLKVDPFFCKPEDGPAVVALVGPTGVGKTTTVAKIAAQMRITCDMRVGLISMDGYRVGAEHQLQSYANLLKVPFRVARSSSDLAEIVRSFKSLDLVLVDTAGCSPRDSERLQSLEEAFHPHDGIERILALPASGNDADLAVTCRAFEGLGVSRCIVTKLDESICLGPLLRVLAARDLPVSFFGTGQRVPEDIEPASFRRLAWLLSTQIH